MPPPKNWKNGRKVQECSLRWTAERVGLRGVDIVGGDGIAEGGGGAHMRVGVGGCRGGWSVSEWFRGAAHTNERTFSIMEVGTLNA